MSNSNWISAPLPPDETRRLEALQRYGILDTPPEEAFDRITRIASRLFKTPIALISLIDGQRQWFKSHHGMDATETPRDMAFCAHAILGKEVLVVGNASADARFAGNPLVTDAPEIRFYAGAPLTTPDGFNLGTLCVIDRDVHMDVAEEDKEILRDLAALVIAELELRNATHIAQKANQAKTEFLASMSHEIRTPMNGILGMAHLLNETRLDTGQKEFVTTINHSARNLLLLLNDILDFSKIEAGELILESAAFNLAAEFRQTVNVFKAMTQQKNISLSCEVQDGFPPLLVGDPGRFAQIVTNLVGNAVKFTDYGGVTASLSYDEARAELRCDVTDTGMGIPPGKQPQIFQKFTQGDVTISRKYGGTGLGLAITKQLITMMGGTIGFESVERKGSHFWFILPAPIPVLTKNATNHEQPEQIFHTPRIPATEARVLIVEDHPINQLFLQKLLGKFGFKHIVTADDGVDAISKALTARYDIIFMDCQMPVMDGYEATTVLRSEENPFTKNLLIVAMTANALAGERERCFRVGMNEYFSKPIDPAKLKLYLEKYFMFTTPPLTVRQPADKERLFDPERMKLVAATKEGERQVLRLFIEMTAHAIVAMRAASEGNDLQRWQAEAHRIRGSAANLGADQIEQISSRAENDPPKDMHSRDDLLSDLSHKIDAYRALAV